VTRTIGVPGTGIFYNVAHGHGDRHAHAAPRAEPARDPAVVTRGEGVRVDGADAPSRPRSTSPWS